VVIQKLNDYRLKPIGCIAPKGGGYYHRTLKGTKEFTDNKQSRMPGALATKPNRESYKDKQPEIIILSSQLSLMQQKFRSTCIGELFP
jgi:hypothetical protein